MPLVRFADVRNQGDGTARIALKTGDNAEVTDFLERGGKPQEISQEQFEKISQFYVLEVVDPSEVKPDGVPEDYDDYTATQATDFLATAPQEQREAVVQYESDNKARKGVLEFESNEADERNARQSAEVSDQQVGSQPAEYNREQAGIEVDLDEDQPH